MRNQPIGLLIFCLFIAACNENSGSGASPGGGHETVHENHGEVSEWQRSLVGQEGHGGDAVVCFNIPIERALYKVKTGPETKCPPGEICSIRSETTAPMGSGSQPSGIVWRMTEEGRRSIQSAKPLEQYLGERISSSKAVIDHLNKLSVEEGYETILKPFQKLPSPSSRLAEMHRKMGWLLDDGISSEYGLMDVNDSGFINETEIDKTRCKELQAVVRRDGQLWYDSDIIRRFDNAGLVLMQLHEEFYAWGKQQDQINREIHGPDSHGTSAKTRRLILKILAEGIDVKLLNENLKTLGFSTMHWENQFGVPTSVGFHMDSETCVAEQRFLHEFFKSYHGEGLELWLAVERLFSERYLRSSNTESTHQLRHNMPDALSNMIAWTLASSASSKDFGNELMRLQQDFEKPESCQGSL